MGHFLFYTVSFLILSTQPKGSRPEQPARYTIFMTPRITYKPTDTASEALEIAQGAIHPFDEYAFGRAVTNGKFEAGFLDRTNWHDLKSMAEALWGMIERLEVALLRQEVRPVRALVGEIFGNITHPFDIGTNTEDVLKTLYKLFIEVSMKIQEPPKSPKEAVMRILPRGASGPILVCTADHFDM